MMSKKNKEKDQKSKSQAPEFKEGLFSTCVPSGGVTLFYQNIGGERETLMRRNGHRGSMSVGSLVFPSVFPSMLVFPSMPKGDIVGKLVVIDVNPWRSLESLEIWLRLMVS
jgi:hypothetical protein